MTMQGRELIGIGAAVMAALVLPTAAVAQSASAKATVDAAKAAGIVGEQPDGFLGFVTEPADPAIRAAVAEINAGRARLYREVAAKNGVTPEAAGAAAYVQVVQSKLKPGEYFKSSDGRWQKK
jgi:uncharacterized protein YdbL (DUF1318 family)